MNKEWLCRQPTEKVFLSNAVLQWMKGKVQLDTTILLMQAFTMGPLVQVSDLKHISSVFFIKKFSAGEEM